MRLALAGELVPDAVNVQGGVIAEDVRPGIPLAEKLGRIFTALAGAVAVAARRRGARRDHRSTTCEVLELAALKGVFSDVVEDPVSYVNAPLLAPERGVEVRLTTDTESRRLPQPGDAARHARRRHPGRRSPARWPGRGTTEKLVEVDGFDIEVALADHMAVFRYDDRPGIVGTVGRILGEAGVNIAGMQVSRDRKGGHALVAMTVDGAIPPAVLDEIVAEIGAATARQVDLTDS